MGAQYPLPIPVAIVRFLETVWRVRFRLLIGAVAATRVSSVKPHPSTELSTDNRANPRRTTSVLPGQVLAIGFCYSLLDAARWKKSPATR